MNYAIKFFHLIKKGEEIDKDPQIPQDHESERERSPVKISSRLQRDLQLSLLFINKQSALHIQQSELLPRDLRELKHRLPTVKFNSIQGLK